jgi:phosphoenolpyruvate carboxylase
MRRIPATMSTQHPDNASAPFWNQDGDGFVSNFQELEEAMVCFQQLGTEEFMWDWEGKFADEAVIDKLFSQYHGYFKQHPLGQEKFLTFRLPNVWQEKGYSLIRALMVILTSEDFAHDLKFHSPPLFEVILPMAEHPSQLLYIQNSFRKLAQFKTKTFDHRKDFNNDYIEVIPLLEGVWNQMGMRSFLEEYLSQHKKYFRRKPIYIRPFLARSDPALISGIVPTVLANKVALSEAYAFGAKNAIKIFPILGAGSLMFRGGMSPENINYFINEYGGVRTVLVQSAFRYDYPLPAVKKAVKILQRELPRRQAQMIPPADIRVMRSVVKKFEAIYQKTLAKIYKDMAPLFEAVPRRRERRQHIGLLAYQRKANKISLPRAINFTAAFYSIGVPPEFIGLGRALKSLSPKETVVLQKYYKNLKHDVQMAGRYINNDNLRQLARKNPAWAQVEKDIALSKKMLDVKLGPKSEADLVHANITSNIFLQRKNKTVVSQLIAETGEIRQSLG